MVINKKYYILPYIVYVYRMAGFRKQKSLGMLIDSAVAGSGKAGVYIMVGLMTLLGHDRTRALGRAAGDVLYFLNRHLRSKIKHNLGLAYADRLTDSEKNAIARTVLQNFGQNWAELFFCAGPKRNDALDAIRIEGRQHLDGALARGRGVIGVSAHMGNYPLVGTGLSKLGYTFVMAVRDLGTAGTSAVYAKSRELIRLPSLATTPEREFYKKALKTLKQNGILCLISDENRRRGGVFVDFFGRPAATATGPATLALRTGAALVPMVIVRGEGNSQTIRIGPPIDYTPTGDNARDIHEMTARFTRVIEEHVRRDPAQWGWTNWRWRTQPWGKAPDAKLRKTGLLKSLKNLLLLRRTRGDRADP